MALNRSENVDFNAEQKQLNDAFSNRDLEDFQLALDMGADPMIPNDSGVCVYEMALSTYGCKEYVEECIKNDCSPYYINQRLDKAAINYAAESMDPRIINILLRHPNIVVNYMSSHLTPLNCLAINVSDHNVDDVISCMHSLMEYGASSTIPDQSGIIPSTHLMQNPKLNEMNKQRISQEFEMMTREKQFQFLQDEVGEKEMPKPIPKFLPRFTLDDVSIKRMYVPVEDDNTISFASAGDWKQINLFFNSIEYKDNMAFDNFMSHAFDCNQKLHGKSALQCALSSGNCHALKRLLNRNDLDIQSTECPLSQVIRKMKEESGNYRKCFYILLKSKRIGINDADDTGSTALHYAAANRNNEAICELLKRGAFIGAKNYSNILAVDNMCPEVLKECFDNCISENTRAVGEKTMRINMNYDNLRLHPNHPQCQYQKEMPCLAFMAKSEDHRHLLEHPLLSSFLRLKWKQFSAIFYINLLLFLIFAFSLMAYIILRFSGSDATRLIIVLRIMSWLGIGYMIIREGLQMITLPRQYFLSATNYMELVLIGLAIVTCRGDSQIDRQTQKVLAVATMLLIAVELFQICGSLPILSMSTHMLMLEAVCKSFLKSFLLYSIFVVTFSFCFYILFGTGEGKADAEGDFNKFTNPLRSVVKTIVMLTGEFDASSIEFSTLYSYLLFLLFVFLMTIVLYNLLNGLAVSDIQTIMGQAKQNGTMCRIDLLARYEEVVTGHSLYNRLMNLYGVTNQSASSYNLPQMNRQTIEEAVTLLEQKKLQSRRQKRIRNTENRLNNIENKLTEVFKRLEAK